MSFEKSSPLRSKTGTVDTEIVTLDDSEEKPKKKRGVLNIFKRTN